MITKTATPCGLTIDIAVAIGKGRVLITLLIKNDTQTFYVTFFTVL